MAKIEKDVILKGDTVLRNISDALTVLVARFDDAKKAASGVQAQANKLESNFLIF